MEGLTLKELVLLITGSGGLIGGIVAAFVFTTSRLDKRRERIKEKQRQDISESADMKKFELDSQNSVHDHLWEIIREKDAEIQRLSNEIEDIEKTSTIQRPVVLKIYANLRSMRKEIESLNLMILSEEETNVFMRRFQTVKVLLDETEGLLP